MKKVFVITALALICLSFYFVNLTNVGTIIVEEERLCGFNHDKIKCIEISVYETNYVSKVIKVEDRQDLHQLDDILGKIVVRPVFMQDYINWIYTFKSKQKQTYDWIRISYTDKKGTILMTIQDKNAMSFEGKMYKILGGYDYEKMYELVSKYYKQ